MKHLEIKDRRDLSFVGNCDQGLNSNWSVPHDPNGYWHDGVRIGNRYFAEVAELARVSEESAFQAIRFAMNSSGWSTRGSGIEVGFSDALARAAIAGLRALARGEPEFDEETCPETIERRRLEAAELAKESAMKRKPRAARGRRHAR